MNTLSRESIIESLVAEGYKFTEMSLVSEGEYSVQDADWNYKDIPHIHHVHPLAEQINFAVGKSVKCAVQLQGILKMWFPLLNVAYDVEKYRTVYISTFFFFIVIIETRSEAVGVTRTRVTTTYSIGAPRVLSFLSPVMKWALRRNYGILMRDDIPMRTRRGALRKLGYKFRTSGETYGFLETTKLSENRLEPPPDAPRKVTCRYSEVLANTKEALIGDIGLLGFRLIRSGSEVMVFPRACPHEGSSLDDSPCVSNSVVCRWHGRRLRPIGKFTWNQNEEFEQGPYRGRTLGDILTIEYVDSSAALYEPKCELVS